MFQNKSRCLSFTVSLHKWLVPSALITFCLLSTEFILGLPLKQTGIYPSMQTDGPNHIIQYGMTLVLSSHDTRYCTL